MIHSVLCKDGSLNIAGVIDVLFADVVCFLELDDRDAENGFSVKVQTMVIFTPVFVNLLFSNSSRLALTVSERKLGSQKKKYT